jgi:hypothetical protein
MVPEPMWRATRDLANKAADAAEGREKTFDFEGVAKHLSGISGLFDHAGCLTRLSAI